MPGQKTHSIPIRPPVYRRLRTFTFDPSLGLRLGTLHLNETVLAVPWEDGHALSRGPVGEYVEVVDYDPAAGCFYEPVDLDDPWLLAQDGLAPSEGNPKFHQQMVYAVAMTTIRHFERALGRLALWAPRLVRDEEGEVVRAEYVQRLRIYPHGLREANAYYSPEKKALLFGYFPARSSGTGDNLPGGVVFTCLSHDVVAHETTHALLDGAQRYFAEPSNPDVLAFHEAFADLVALFQHFSQPEALRHEIARTRGDLARENLLADLARQFGQALGNRGALRSAIGSKPDPAAYATATEPHTRGAVLIAAVFEAFLAVYRERTADLLRIATGGTGRLPRGEIHPDLVNRLAREAARSADNVLQHCIRALDYCPPVDITFGEYLRALVTALTDFGADDATGYGVALVNAFRVRGIFPRDVQTLSLDSLLWQPPDGIDRFNLLVSDLINRIYLKGRVSREWPREEGPADDFDPVEMNNEFLTWTVMTKREKAYQRMAADRRLLHGWLAEKAGQIDQGRILGLALGGPEVPSTIDTVDGRPKFRVHTARPARRQDVDGRPLMDLVVQITQKRRGLLDPEEQAEADRGRGPQGTDFIFRGGCTLLIDLANARVRRCIVKDILSDERLEYQRAFRAGGSGQTLRDTYFGAFHADFPEEPFALLHRGPAGAEP